MQGNLLELVTSRRVALDVVGRLNIAANPAVQAQYRNSDAFRHESIEDWLASSFINNVNPGFAEGSNVLSIRYVSGDPSQAALFANAFLAATVDELISIKTKQSDQTAKWLAPQLEDLRKELETARAALENFQSQTNLVAPTGSPDTETTMLMSISQDLSKNKAVLTALQSRLSSVNTNLAVDPSDPDLRLLNGLKEKLTILQTEVETGKTALGANNPKMVAAAANMASLRKQVAEATEKMLQRLKERISTTQNQIASLEAEQAAAEKALIAAQAQRFRLGVLQTDVRLREEQVNKRKEEAAKLKLQSQLTFGDVAVLDKATPPIEPFFPKRPVVLSVAISASAILELILALIAEMLDRRVRSTADLEFVTSAAELSELFRPRGARHGDWEARMEFVRPERRQCRNRQYRGRRRLSEPGMMWPTVSALLCVRPTQIFSFGL